MSDNMYLDLQAKLVAQDFILRILFAERMMKEDRPRASTKNWIEGSIQSMRKIAEKESATTAHFFPMIEASLREFAANIDARLAGEGFQE